MNTITLYKYTPYIQEFIETPALRLTPRKNLNDPFELRPTKTVEKLFEKKDLSVPPSDSRETYISLYTHWNKGIISLSETWDNPLMWSHYADSHRGGVIKLTFNLEDSKLGGYRVRKFFKKIADNQYYFDRVRYRRSREPDLESFNSYFDSYSAENLVSKALAFTKADFWSYEQEHRFVVSLTDCDFLYAKWWNEKDRETVIDSINSTYNNSLEVDPDKKRVYLKPNHFHKDKNPFIMNDTGIVQLDKNIELFRFLDVEPSAVTGIYLGSEMDGTVRKQIRVDKDGHLAKFTNLGNNIKDVMLCDNDYKVHLKS